MNGFVFCFLINLQWTEVERKEAWNKPKTKEKGRQSWMCGVFLFLSLHSARASLYFHYSRMK